MYSAASENVNVGSARRRWHTLCQALGVTDEGLANMLLDIYESTCTVVQDDAGNLVIKLNDVADAEGDKVLVDNTWTTDKDRSAPAELHVTIVPDVEESVVKQEPETQQSVAAASKQSHKHVSHQTGMKRSGAEKQEPRIQCLLCSKKFYTKRLFTTHMNTEHHNIEDKPLSDKNRLICTKCDVTFPDELSMMQHIAEHRRGPAVCELCHEVLSNCKDLYQHYQDCHDKELHHICAQCGCRYPTKERLRAHSVVHRQAIWKPCMECGKMYKGSLVTHMLSHKRTRDVNCKYCPAVLKHANSLRDHIRTIHGPLEYKPCHVCGKQIATVHMTRHVRLQHSEKRYRCDVCGRSFVHSCNLRQHMVTHTKEKRFACSYCDRKFTQKHSVRTHEMLHTNDLPYKCDICEKAFVRSYFVKRHKLTAHGVDAANTVVLIEQEAESDDRNELTVTMVNE